MGWIFRLLRPPAVLHLRQVIVCPGPSATAEGGGAQAAAAGAGGQGDEGTSGSPSQPGEALGKAPTWLYAAGEGDEILPDQLVVGVLAHHLQNEADSSKRKQLRFQQRASQLEAALQQQHAKLQEAEAEVGS